MNSNRRDALRMMGFGAAAFCAAGMAGTAAQAASDQSQPMDAFNAMKTRRSIRAYKNEPVTDAQINAMLEAAMQAPSAANEQPWEFVVIKDSGTLGKVGAINKYAAYAAKAPLGILVCLNEQKEKIKGMGILDVAMCAENLLLAANALGLGAVFTGIYPDEDRIKGFQQLVNLPADVIPVGLLVIGHPLMPKPAESRMNPEAVHKEKW